LTHLNPKPPMPRRDADHPPDRIAASPDAPGSADRL
jgi:hypothetical protein